MSDKHTPGPWEVFICDDGGEWTGWPISIHAANEDDKSIVRTGGMWPYEWDAATSQAEAVANARLIAAAPDLYEALRDMLDGWKYIRSVHGDLYGVGWDRAQDKAVAALAKARGESNG